MDPDSGPKHSGTQFRSGSMPPRLPVNLRFRTNLELLVLVGADLDPVLHVVQVFPFPFPAVLRGHLVPDLPSDLLQIALLLPEREGG